jgi:hypothetical protein
MIDHGQEERSLQDNYFDYTDVRERFYHLLLYSYDLLGRDLVVGGDAVEGSDG